MKYAFYILFLVTFSLSFQSCNHFDNYDEPKSMLYGKVTYNGEYIGVRGSAQKVQMQLYQDGYVKKDPIPVYVTQDGSFQALLFDGEYKLITRDKNGPWENKRDTLYITVKGNTTCEYPVNPYFLVKNEVFNVNGNTLKASCNIQEITKGKAITSVFLLVNRTAFVDDVNTLSRISIPNPTVLENIQIEMDLSKLPTESLYARIGVQISGVGDFLFSKIQQIK